MKVAIISDIHSNKYALNKVLDYLRAENISHLVVLGDIFGYYPWAQETYKQLMNFQAQKWFILGNHDLMLLGKEEQIEELTLVILQNKNDLSEEAFNWLSKLKPKMNFEINNQRFSAFHGTPKNPINGRHYPNSDVVSVEGIEQNATILLGHTHYPLEHLLESGQKVINPGSVGQPRDGDQRASFCIFETKNQSVEFIRLEYEVEKTIAELEKMDWYPRAIRSLQKK